MGLFSETKQLARSCYRNYVQKGIAEGRRKDLTGGGLIRSAGGWSAIKSLRKAGIRLKGDERILGDSDFVEQVLKSAQESFERKYILESEGYDFNAVIRRVTELLDIKPEEILSPNKKPQTVKARSLVCYWCNRDLGLSTVDIANRLKIGQPAVSRAISRGENIANKYRFALLPRKA